MVVAVGYKRGGFIRSILKRFLVQRSFFFVELLQLLQLPEHSIVSFVRSSSCMAMAWLGNSKQGGVFSAPSEPSSIQVHFSLLVVLNGQARRATPTFPQSLSQFAKIKSRQNQLFPAFRHIRGARVRCYFCLRWEDGRLCWERRAGPTIFHWWRHFVTAIEAHWSKSFSKFRVFRKVSEIYYKHSDFLWNQFWSYWNHQNCHFHNFSCSEFWIFGNFWHFQVGNSKIKIETLQNDENDNFWQFFQF